MRIAIRDPKILAHAVDMLDGICQQLADLRTDAGLSQAEACRAIGVNINAMRWWESGQRHPNMPNFLQWLRSWELRPVVLDAAGVRRQPADDLPVGVLDWQWAEFQRLTSTLRGVRLGKGLTQTEFARMTTISRELLSNFENSVSFARPVVLCGAASVLGCSIHLEPLPET